MTAAEAARWGLVNQVVPAAEVMAAARGLADRVCAPRRWRSRPCSRSCARPRRRDAAGYAIQRGDGLPAYRAMLSSQDAQEGARAFTERRPPVWRGR